MTDFELHVTINVSDYFRARATQTPNEKLLTASNDDGTHPIQHIFTKWLVKSDFKTAFESINSYSQELQARGLTITRKKIEQEIDGPVSECDYKLETSQYFEMHYKIPSDLSTYTKIRKFVSEMNKKYNTKYFGVSTLIISKENDFNPIVTIRTFENNIKELNNLFLDWIDKEKIKITKRHKEICLYDSWPEEDEGWIVTSI